jgi:hypothetical protein
LRRAIAREHDRHDLRHLVDVQQRIVEEAVLVDAAVREGDGALWSAQIRCPPWICASSVYGLTARRIDGAARSPRRLQDLPRMLNAAIRTARSFTGQVTLRAAPHSDGMSSTAGEYKSFWLRFANSTESVCN